MRNPNRLTPVLAALALLAPIGPAQAAATIPAGSSPALATTAPVSGDTYTFADLESGDLLDIGGSSAAPGSGAVQWAADGDSSQQWTIVENGASGAYELVNANSQLCLAAPGGSAGAQLVQQTCSMAASELWQLNQNSVGDVSLVNVGAGMSADVAGASPVEGTDLVQSSSGSSLSQLWRMTQLTRVGTWTAGSELLDQSFDDQTIRMVVHSTGAGSLAEIRLTNLYGTAPLAIGAVDVSVQSTTHGTAVTGTHHTATFGGVSDPVIPAGADLVSDPIPMSVGAGQDLLVSVYLPDAVATSTGHQDAMDDTWISAGDQASSDAMSTPTEDSSWFFLDGLNVISPTADGTLVCVGDSITDGVTSDPTENDRWPDDLAGLLNAVPGGSKLSVEDSGIGSNEVLADTPEPSGSFVLTNPALESRFAHDVLDQPDVKDIVLLEGINDIGYYTGSDTAAMVSDMEAGYTQIIHQAHAQGIKVYGGTIMPYEGFDSKYFSYTSTGNTIRLAVNSWIRTSGAFDGVIDFATAMEQSSSDPDQLDSSYDSGDHLHPNEAGYQVMARTADQALLTPTPGGALQGDGTADLVTTNSDGTVLDYPAGTTAESPTVLSENASVPSGSPTDSWSNYLITHRGDFTGNTNSTSTSSVDDLWALDTVPDADGDDDLYLYANSGSNPFENTANVIDVTRAGIDADGGCRTIPGETDCTDYDAQSWNDTSEILAPGDLYTGSALDNGLPDLLTVEHDPVSGAYELWLYQGYYGAGYLQNPVEIGTTGWNQATLIGAGVIAGRPTFWARDTSSGVIYSYALSFYADGYPKSLGPIDTAGTQVATGFSATQYPALASPGATPGQSTPALYAVTASNQLEVFPDIAAGTSHDTIGSIDSMVDRWAYDPTCAQGANSATGLNDLTGHGAISCTAATAGGVTKPAFKLDGTTGYADAAGPVVDTSQNYTISAWADPTAITAGTNQEVATICGADHCGLYLEINADGDWELSRAASDASGTVAFDSVVGGAAVVNTWVHLVGVYDAASRTLTFYVNGAQVASVTAAPWAAGGPFTIGAELGGTATSFFGGYVSDVRLYSAALSPGEVLADYDGVSHGIVDQLD